MPSIFLVTFLSCSQVQSVIKRLENVVVLTPKQKTEIVQELKKVVPTCPIIVRK